MVDEISGPRSIFDSTGNSGPVVLHVLHSWGGGIDFFARDLQTGDQHRKHFFLKSHSRDNLPPFGKELSLYQNLDKEPLATWQLSAPVMDTDLHSDEVHGVLRSIIEKWTIGAVIVSSLIGHSIDVLTTGLPTALAIHDVYPFWPLLHDANTNDYSVDYLHRSLSDHKSMNVFAERPADEWIAIKDALISTILQRNIICISPSFFAKERVCGIDSRLRDARWSIIPHGIAMQPMGGSATSKPIDSPGKLRVLVPGHINGGKGEVLLNSLIPRLPEGIELVLLGSAHLSDHFASEKVSTIEHYRREQLSEIISDLQPDIALLASTVPETYGYVLSEMLQSGVPVICSNIGAYAERGADLPSVTLVNPEVEPFLEALIQFRDNPIQLEEQKCKLPHVFSDLREMADSWRALLPANPPQWLFELSDDPGIGNEVKMNLQITHLAEILKSVKGATEKNAQSTNEVLDFVGKQQSSIERMLESMDRQGRQITEMLGKQNDFGSALLNQNRQLETIKENADEQKNALKQQLVLASEHERKLNERIEKNRVEFELKVASILESANTDKQVLLAGSTQLQARVNLLTEELAAMQAKRGWRFLSFFR